MRSISASLLASVLAGGLILSACSKTEDPEPAPGAGGSPSSTGGKSGSGGSPAAGSGGTSASGGSGAATGGTSASGSGGSPAATGGTSGGTGGSSPSDAADETAPAPTDGPSAIPGNLGPGSADDSPPLVLPGSTLAFNGKDLTGWMCDPKFWSVKNGIIVGAGSGNNFCYTAADHDTFRITGKSRMEKDPSNHAGICFWGTRKPSGDCLQITPVSGSLWDYGGAPANARQNDRPFPYTKWAFFEILVDFNKKTVDIAVEGKAYPTYNDRGPAARRKKGPIGLQLHAKPNEVWYKDIAIEANPTQMKLLTAKP